MRNARVSGRHGLANWVVRLRPLRTKAGLSGQGRILGPHGVRGCVAADCTTPAGLAPYHRCQYKRWSGVPDSRPRRMSRGRTGVNTAKSTSSPPVSCPNDPDHPISPLQWSLEHRVKAAIEAREDRKNTLAAILATPGGVVEVVERTVRVFRQHHDEVKFIIPDRAMSAGAVLAMSGDDIPMDHHSCLGPIDPQLEKDGRLVPALSHLSQFETLSTAEAVL